MSCDRYEIEGLEARIRNLEYAARELERRRADERTMHFRESAQQYETYQQDINELNERADDMRRAVLNLLAAFSLPGEFTLNDWEDWNGAPMEDEFRAVMVAFNITEDDVLAASAARDRAFQEEDET